MNVVGVLWSALVVVLQVVALAEGQYPAAVAPAVIPPAVVPLSVESVMMESGGTEPVLADPGVVSREAADVTIVTSVGPRGLMFHPFWLKMLSVQTIPFRAAVVVITSGLQRDQLVLDTRVKGLVYEAHPAALKLKRGRDIRQESDSEMESAKKLLSLMSGISSHANGLNRQAPTPGYFTTRSAEFWERLAYLESIHVPRQMQRIPNLRYYFSTATSSTITSPHSKSTLLAASLANTTFVDIVDDDSFIHPQRTQVLQEALKDYQTRGKASDRTDTAEGKTTDGNVDAVYHTFVPRTFQSVEDLETFKVWRGHTYQLKRVDSPSHKGPRIPVKKQTSSGSQQPAAGTPVPSIPVPSTPVPSTPVPSTLVSYTTAPSTAAAITAAPITTAPITAAPSTSSSSGAFLLRPLPTTVAGPPLGGRRLGEEVDRQLGDDMERVTPAWAFWVASDGLTDVGECDTEAKAVLDDLYLWANPDKRLSVPRSNRWKRQGVYERVEWSRPPRIARAPNGTEGVNWRLRELTRAGRISMKYDIPIVWPRLFTQPPEEAPFDVRYLTCPESHWKPKCMAKGAALIRRDILLDPTFQPPPRDPDVYFFWRLLRKCRRVHWIDPVLQYNLDPPFDEY
ncbi:hypothetical protein GNI_055190 [Gregarina niphandrodes]|uniref:Transmembrane protein n=1 Tax=Gregarina niphandrodes TaxID=110365 RepID=A0A023B901_GRENI|nr:hypothetical protein GNI_055190 [Gregarina niphandrodes]EZG70556.1 hypothetical protein GNI_055190 [Gregarina niphandrodes]|eukprot:XP_011129913.1 hypothetical protein GNI_055190 [Gregarina niphandrodes]